MASFQLAPIGRVDFPVTEEGYWEFELQRAGDPVRVDFNADGTELTPQAFARVQHFVSNIDAFDAVARKAIRADFAADPDGSSAMYLNHHAEEFSADERLKYLGVNDPKALGIEQLLQSVRLRRVGLYPDSEDYLAVFDYSLDPDATQYLLAIEFDASDTVVGISMDS